MNKRQNPVTSAQIDFLRHVAQRPEGELHTATADLVWPLHERGWIFAESADGARWSVILVISLKRLESQGKLD